MDAAARTLDPLESMYRYSFHSRVRPSEPMARGSTYNLPHVTACRHDESGTLHALFHREGGSAPQYTAAHAYSCDDGVSWTHTGGSSFSKTYSRVASGRAIDRPSIATVTQIHTGPAFNTTVRYTDGTSFVFSRRERPHVIMGDSARPHTPTHLSSAVQYGGEYGDATMTLIQPIVVV